MTQITIDFTSLDSIAEAISFGITTPQQVADHLGIDLIDDCIILEESPMFADDGNAEVAYSHDTTASDAAHQYVETGDSGDRDTTSWVDVWTYRKGVNESGPIIRVEEESHTITLEAEEPECIDGEEHIWHTPYSILGGCKENPGCWGNGGGVVIKEICRCCGTVKVTDTWAQNPSNGIQGLTSVEYEVNEYADEMNARSIKRAKDYLDTSDEPQDDFDFCWTDDEGDLVGCSEDDLLEYGRQLARDKEAQKIHGTLVQMVEA